MLLLLLALCSLHQAEAYGAMGTVKVVTTNLTSSFESVQAAFGPTYGWQGFKMEGVMVFVRPHNACTPEIQPPADDVGANNSNKIALIKRNDCLYDKKVLHVQRAGYKAAVVYNTLDDSLYMMSGSGIIADKVSIPSVFVGLSAGRVLEAALYDTGAVVELTLEGWRNLYYYLIPFVAVVAVCIFLILLFLCVRWCCELTRARRSRLSKRHLKKLPTKKFKPNQDLYETCAICLEDYKEGEKIRMLPCKHAFHQQCIDPWLLGQKRVCPCCKRRVLSRTFQVVQDESGSDSGDERTPLIRPASAAERRYLSGLPEERSDTPRGEGQSEFWAAVHRARSSSQRTANTASPEVSSEGEPTTHTSQTAFAEVVVERVRSNSGTSYGSCYSNPGRFTPASAQPLSEDLAPCEHEGACGCANPKDEDEPVVIRVKVEVPRTRKVKVKQKKRRPSRDSDQV